MRSGILGFTLGVLWLQQQSSLWNWQLLAATALLASFGLWNTGRLHDCLRYRVHGRALPAFRVVINMSFGIMLGWGWAGLMAVHALERRLPVELEEQELLVAGTVSGLPSRSDFGEHFQFRIEQLLNPTSGPLLRQSFLEKVLLSWNAREGLTPQSGERWRLRIKLRRPHGLANPHGFDYEIWLLEQGIGATGSVRLRRPGDNGADPNQRLAAFVVTPEHCIGWIRTRLREKIAEALSNYPAQGMIAALVIGDQGAIPATDWQLFSRAGINHLVAISGLHISMLAGLGYRFLFYGWRTSFFTRRQLPLWIPAQKVAALGSVLLALIYAALAGFGVPAQRAIVMIMVAAAALWSARRLATSQVLSMALLAVLLMDPWAVVLPGFWLSFAAVALIFYVSPASIKIAADEVMPNQPNQPNQPSQLRWRRYLQSLRNAATVQYAITIGLVPLTIFLFSQTSLISPAANALAIPVISVLVTPLALLGSLVPGWPGRVILQGSAWLLQGLMDCLQQLASISWAVWQIPHPDFWMLVWAMVGTLWMLAPAGWPWRWAGLLSWLPFLWNAPGGPAGNELMVMAFDVGQGTAVLIETAHHRLLVDSGPAYGTSSDAGGRVIYPYLKSRGIDSLDGMLISHHDTDHAGGALTLLQNIKIGWVSSSLDIDSSLVQAAQQYSRHLRCQAGQHWVWDTVDFEILHPGAAIYASKKWHSNARSCTLKIRFGAYSILLPGDMEATQEQELALAQPQKLAATVLFAPHHGSATSSTDSFLELVHPQWAVFQVGYHNRYHHPNPVIWQRYADHGIQRLRSDDSGALTFTFGQTLRIDEYRRSHLRYWYPVATATEPLTESAGAENKNVPVLKGPALPAESTSFSEPP